MLLFPLTHSQHWTMNNRKIQNAARSYSSVDELRAIEIYKMETEIVSKTIAELHRRRRRDERGRDLSGSGGLHIVRQRQLWGSLFRGHRPRFAPNLVKTCTKRSTTIYPLWIEVKVGLLRTCIFVDLVFLLVDLANVLVDSEKIPLHDVCCRRTDWRGLQSSTEAICHTGVTVLQESGPSFMTNTLGQTFVLMIFRFVRDCK